MGFVFMTGACYGCGKPFTFNPNLVPSIRIDGHRQPLCLTCVERANPQRIKNGLEPIVPKPGAYEAADEHSIDWNDHD